MNTTAPTPELIRGMDPDRRATDYLSTGQTYSDPSFSMRADRVEAAWQIRMPRLGAWAGSYPPTFPKYAAGGAGPSTVDELLARTGHAWRPIA